MASLATMPENSENENQNEAMPILLDTPVAFKFMMLNVLGHDFMHDFLLNTTRTAKNKKIISSISTTIRSLGKILTKNNVVKNLNTFINSIRRNKKGGGKKKKRKFTENSIFYRKGTRQSERIEDQIYNNTTNYKFNEAELYNYLIETYGENSITKTGNQYNISDKMALILGEQILLLTKLASGLLLSEKLEPINYYVSNESAYACSKIYKQSSIRDRDSRFEKLFNRIIFNINTALETYHNNGSFMVLLKDADDNKIQNHNLIGDDYIQVKYSNKTFTKEEDKKNVIEKEQSEL